MKENTKITSLKALAEDLVDYGKRQGADEIEVSVADGTEFSVDVRMGSIESLVEAGSRIAGIKVIKDKKTAFASSSDMSRITLKKIIRNAVQRASLGHPDEFSGLPPAVKNPDEGVDLSIWDSAIAELDAKTKIDLALETEKIALEDRRITNSHGAGFETKQITSILANSNGFLGDYQETFCSLGVGLQAGETDNRVEDSWTSSVVHYKDLETPETVAKKAVQRTVRQLNPKKTKTQRVPVIFEPTMTSWLLGFIFSCVSGVAVYQKASFLAEKLGKNIASPLLTIVDNGRIKGKLGTKPFDSEGVPTRNTTIIDRGRLKSFLCNTYAGRKLGLASTGNADGNGVGPNNFYLLPGATAPEEMISSTDRGLLLIRTIGHGLNPVTGEISRGAFGLWIERGEIVYPVSEITISGNLEQVLKDISLVGNDLEFRSMFSGPTIKIGELTVAGT